MALETTLIEMNRKINSLQTMVNDHNRRLIHAPLHAGPSKVLTIASGAVGATRPYIHLVPESGITDTLDSITNGSDGKMVVISNSRVGDTITINPFSVGGGNIDLNGATAAYDLDNVHESITLIYRESTLHWELVSGGVIPSGSIGAHAPSHQHGGTDEVATATPAANAIPKAGVSGDLDIGWINQADILTDNITASATNNFISDAELVKLAGIEALADVTDQANVGAAIDTSPEQTVLASGNKIAMTDAGVLEWVDWDTILATLGGSFVDLTTNQNVGGEKTWQAKAVFEASVVLSGTTAVGSAPLTVYDNGVSAMAYWINEVAATYADATPNAQMVLRSRFTGEVVNIDTARLKWGLTATFSASGARFGVDVINSAGAWINAFTVRGNGEVVFSGTSGNFTLNQYGAFGVYATLNATGSQEAVLGLGNPAVNWQLWRKPSPDTSLYFYNGTERLILSTSGYQFEGNARGKYSSGLDFAFFTGTDAEVMGNAEWNGSAYRRYITGRAAKVTVGDEGWFRVYTNDATDVAANITWGDPRLTIDNRGTMAFGTTDIEAWSTLYPAIALGGSSGIMASSTTNGLYILEAMYYDGAFKRKNATNAPLLIAMTNSGIIFYADATGAADSTVSATARFAILPTGRVGIGTVTPQGKLHIHDGTSGWLKETKTGVNATAQTVLPSGTIVRGAIIALIANDGTNVGNRDAVFVLPGANTTVIAGTTTATLAISAGGTVTVQRTAGAGTLAVTIDMFWQ